MRMLAMTLPAAILAAGLAAPLRASALPLVGPTAREAAQDAAPDARIIQVYDGCGPYRHRGPYGGCRGGGQLGGYVPGRACPPGWHIGPYGRRYWRDAGFSRPRLYRTYAYGERRFGWHGGYPRSGWHRRGGYRRVGWHGGWHRRVSWHGGRRWGGFRRVVWHRGGVHRGGVRHRR